MQWLIKMNNFNAAINAIEDQESNGIAAPVLKWAGGKTQLIASITKHFPIQLLNGHIKTYIEPFVGGGAVFFHLANTCTFRHAYLFDVNPELVIVYNSVRDSVGEVISALASLEKEYIGLVEEKRAALFYHIRDKYNREKKEISAALCNHSVIPERGALTIFLNRTCFNGLFRVNKNGSFNVPHGRYKKPAILNETRLRAASSALQRATVRLADFSECLEIADNETFIYYDPPYRPVSRTSNFTSYSRDVFDDAEQRRLFEIFKKLHEKGVMQLLSNSDPTNYEEDSFFDDLYHEFSILRVTAKRMINSDSSKRGELRELLIKNY